jgi:hypothetical protein
MSQQPAGIKTTYRAEASLFRKLFSQDYVNLFIEKAAIFKVCLIHPVVTLL